jgi:hypothetical protein
VDLLSNFLLGYPYSWEGAAWRNLGKDRLPWKSF